jgi:membrane associated rhomboid family serine protease
MTPWVRRLIVANAIVFGLQYLQPGITDALVLVPDLVLQRPWTLVTYMFLHAGFWHIALNMLALFWFGGRVEERLGGSQFLALYLVSGVGGALASFATPHVAVLGASGAIMGVMIAFAMYWPRARFFIWGVIPVEAWLLVTIYIVLDVTGAAGVFGGNVAHFTHLGGLATGFLYLKTHDWLSPARAWKRKVGAAPEPPRILGDADHLRRWRDIRLDSLHPINRDEIVRLLQKVDTDGPRSLTPEERATLNRFAATSPVS